MSNLFVKTKAGFSGNLYVKTKAGFSGNLYVKVLKPTPQAYTDCLTFTGNFLKMKKVLCGN